MSQTLVISDELHARLQSSVREHGFQTVEQLLEFWQTQETERRQRQTTVAEIDQLRRRLFDKYGVAPDSVALLREDRER